MDKKYSLHDILGFIILFVKTKYKKHRHWPHVFTSDMAWGQSPEKYVKEAPWKEASVLRNYYRGMWAFDGGAVVP